MFVFSSSTIIDGYHADAAAGQQWTDVPADCLEAFPAYHRLAVANAVSLRD
jgi:hypothetical protein